MPKVEDVKTLNIDGTAYEVDTMSVEVKKMVEVFNEWNHDEAIQRQNLMKTQAAKNDLSRQIILQVRKDLEPEKVEAEEEPATEVVEGVEDVESV